MKKTENLKILENAISDVGYWSWWIDEFPEIFQVEFGGTQLWNPPRQENSPPSNQIALKFTGLKSVVFLTMDKDFLPDDWPDKFQKDEIDNLTINYDKFTLTDFNLIHDLINIATNINLKYGKNPKSINDSDDLQILAFQAGQCALIVIAKNMEIYNHLGELELKKIKEINQKWWEYWKEYWEKKDAGIPLPKDYTCEVTLPIKGQ